MTPGSAQSNGGAESYVELAKAINTLGDTRLSLSVNAARWALNPGRLTFDSGTHTFLQDGDYDFALLGFKPSGAPVILKKSLTQSSVAGDLGSACFGMAIDLETSNGLEISGLNAEEQSDISLIIRYSHAQQANFAYDVFTYIDAMIVLKENNVKLLLKIGFGVNRVKCMFLK